MSNEEEAEQIDEELEKKYGELLDVNREIIQTSRQKIKGILELREVYLDQVGRCEEIAALHARGAQLVGETFGDILANEWGLDEVEPDDDDQDEN